MQQDWQWQETSGFTYLTCGLLEPWHHGFCSRSTWPEKPETFVEHWFPTQPVQTFRTKQVHGNTVLQTDQLLPLSADRPEVGVEADGLIASPQGITTGVWVASADCTPVLIGDRGTGRVAALHAGWRGTAAEIVPLALQRLQAQGSTLENLCIALGPAIAGSVYPVHRPVALQVCQTIVDEPLDLDSPLEAWQTLLDPLAPQVLQLDADPQKVRLDVRQVIAAQVQRLGIRPDQMTIAPYCTYQTPEHFFSYRRTGEKAVQWSGILASVIPPG